MGSFVLTLAVVAHVALLTQFLYWALQLRKETLKLRETNKEFRRKHDLD